MKQKKENQSQITEALTCKCGKGPLDTQAGNDFSVGVVDVSMCLLAPT